MSNELYLLTTTFSDDNMVERLQGELASSRLRVSYCALTRNLIWIMPT